MPWASCEEAPVPSIPPTTSAAGFVWRTLGSDVDHPVPHTRLDDTAYICNKLIPEVVIYYMFEMTHRVVWAMSQDFHVVQCQNNPIVSVIIEER